MSSATHVDLPEPSRRRRILSAGHNSALLRLRNSFIQTAGYQVVTTKEAELLMDLVSKQDFDAIVLCSSIPTQIKEYIARDVRKLKPQTPLIVICSDDEQPRFQALAHQVVTAEDGVSQPLIEAIFKLAGDPDESRR
jgi:DNA-binding response OmpR family regulator